MPAPPHQESFRLTASWERPTSSAEHTPPRRGRQLWPAESRTQVLRGWPKTRASEMREQNRSLIARLWHISHFSQLLRKEICIQKEVGGLNRSSYTRAFILYGPCGSPMEPTTLHKMHPLQRATRGNKEALQIRIHNVQQLSSAGSYGHGRPQGVTEISSCFMLCQDAEASVPPSGRGVPGMALFLDGPGHLCGLKHYRA